MQIYLSAAYTGAQVSFTGYFISVVAWGLFVALGIAIFVFVTRAAFGWFPRKRSRRG